MSNITNFINFRELCPVCNNSLKFHSLYKNLTRFINNDISIELEINLNPASQTKVKFTINLFIDLNSNKFKIEFLSKNKEYLNFIPLKRINLCKQFLLLLFYFYKDCGICRQYTYTSSFIHFDFKSSTIEPFNVKSETIFFSKKLEYKTNRYHLLNILNENKSVFSFDNQLNENFQDCKNEYCVLYTLPFIGNSINLPFIQIININNLIQKLDTYLTFL